MVVDIAYGLSGMIGLGIILIGARYLWAPQAAAAGFGIPGMAAGPACFHAWLSVKAVRDIASGILIFLLMRAATPALLGAVVLALTVIPVGDAMIVLRSKGPKAAAYGIHGATALVMVLAGVVLLRG